VAVGSLNTAANVSLRNCSKSKGKRVRHHGSEPRNSHEEQTVVVFPAKYNRKRDTTDNDKGRAEARAWVVGHFDYGIDRLQALR
jgi:hypothetical protein